MHVTLDQIVAATCPRVADRKRAADLRALERQAADHRPRGFRASLARQTGASPAIIAELKKASPSKGLIRPNFNVKEIALEYAAAGATALSVLTEEEFFLGSLGNLRCASAAVQLPCLEKDFVVDPFQLVEARAHGADAVLLLAAVLSDQELAQLLCAARELALDALCEVHDETELRRALAAGCKLIGVNNRDLRTFQVDLRTAIRLGPLIPEGIVKVAESGIRSVEDIRNLRGAGYNAFLVGESLMKAEKPGDALAKLMQP